MPELFDVLTEDGEKTGRTKDRKEVHRDGDWHAAIHCWIVDPDGNLLLQKRALHKDSHPGMWDISSAGHITAGEGSLETAVRELEEELGICMPPEAFEFLFRAKTHFVTNGGTFINNEFDDVYLITLLTPIPTEAMTLQESEVMDVKYAPYSEVEAALERQDPAYVPADLTGDYAPFFSLLRERFPQGNRSCGGVVSADASQLKQEIDKYVPVTLAMGPSPCGDAHQNALKEIVRASQAVDDTFISQVWGFNSQLGELLRQHCGDSELAELQHKFFEINKSPWSVLLEGKAFIHSFPAVVSATATVSASVVIHVPPTQPPRATFYPWDMTPDTFNHWVQGLSTEMAHKAKDYFTYIRWADNDRQTLQFVEYNNSHPEELARVATHLRQAAAAIASEDNSLAAFLTSRAEAFLSNDYRESDVHWLSLDSPLDITIGPYETYMDGLFGYKASFEAFVGVTEPEETRKLKTVAAQLPSLEMQLPMSDAYKNPDVSSSAPIRVASIVYASGDVAGPMTTAFNLPNDEAAPGTAQVLLRNVSEAKFEHIMRKISEMCIAPCSQSKVTFDSFFTHTLCHELVHGIGPHNITVDSKSTTVRLQLQDLHSSIEEAKADIGGLWAMRKLVDSGVLDPALKPALYVTFLAGCFRSVRFGLEEAHGKGQALQFNYLLESGAFTYDEATCTFDVNEDTIARHVEKLTEIILTLQAEGSKQKAQELLGRYAVLSPPLKAALSKLQDIPVDIFPTYPLAQDR